MYDYIEFIICYGEGVTPADVKGETRKGEIVFARQLIMYFSVQNKVGTYAFIAECLGGMDHATVNHSLKVIKNYITTDKAKKSKIDYYTQLLGKVIILATKKDQLIDLLKPLEEEISALEARCINLNIQVAFLKQKTAAAIEN